MSKEEREYLQKLERNKVAFEAWLEKKKYEQEVSQCARLLWFHISCGLNPIPAASSCSTLKYDANITMFTHAACY